MNPKGMIKVVGVNEVISNLLKTRTKIGVPVERGLKKAGLFLLREADKIIPVQTGKLRASKFIVSFGTGIHSEVILGYRAEYAALVHEIPNPPIAHGKAFNLKHASEIAAAKGTFMGTAEGGMFNRRENEQFKYLEKPARDKRKDMLIIIRNTICNVK